MISFRKQRGFSLVAAIFLLIVLASLGAYMVTIGGTSRATSTAALQGARAYQAARSGIDWAVFLISNAANPTDARLACNGAVNDINGNNFVLNVAGLSGFTVNTTCNFTIHDELGTGDVTVYIITSTATAGGVYGNPDFVQRRITTTISPSPP